MIGFQKGTVHLRPLSKEGEFVELRLTMLEARSEGTSFEGSKKKFAKRLRLEKIELPLRPLSREVLLRMWRKKNVERISSETFEESYKQQYICLRFLQSI